MLSPPPPPPPPSRPRCICIQTAGPRERRAGRAAARVAAISPARRDKMEIVSGACELRDQKSRRQHG
ncbi:Protein of unknown function [Gryllus bimaculatus]|nr:Protein of unknown function [Gryllus bimaculatus]